MAEIDLLKESLKHVAVIGQFTLRKDSDPVVREPLHKEIEKQLETELAYFPATKKIGKYSTEYLTFAVCAPAKVPQENLKEDDNKAKSIKLTPDHPLWKTLKNCGETAKPAEVGAKLFVGLLDALDELVKYWKPEMDRRLTAAVIQYLTGKQHNKTLITTGVAKTVFEDPEINPAVLAYLRAGPKQESRFINGELLLKKLKIFNIDENQVDAIFEHLKKFKNELNGGQSSDKELAADWKKFRSRAEIIEDFVACEPLIALVINYMFCKVSSAGETDTIAEDLIDKVYKADGRKMAARLNVEQLREDQRVFTEAARQCGKMTDKDPLKAVFDTVMNDLEEHRKYTSMPKPSYSRKDIIDRNIALIKMIAVYAIEGIDEIIEAQCKIIDQNDTIYREFEAVYGDTLNITKLKDAIGEEKPEWFDEFCNSHSEKTGKELGDAFRREPGQQEKPRKKA